MPMAVMTVAQMRAWEEASWAAGRSASQVIQRVGQLIAARVLRLTSPGERVLILAGRGHNGDDARCVQPHLPNRVVELVNVAEPGRQLGEVQAALDREPAIVVDGLFGIGLNRSLDEGWAAVVGTLNHSGLPVLSVDVPSGLDANTGLPLGAAVRARWTVTLGAPKGGLLKATAWEHTGRVELEPEIGLVEWKSPGSEPELWWSLASDFRQFPPRRPAAGHKGTFGHLLILAGSKGYHGAAVLAARGAQRARPGLITLGAMPQAVLPAASQLQAVMVDDWDTARTKLETCTGLLIGPGLAAAGTADRLQAEVAALWRSASVPVAVDASALAWLPPGPVEGAALRVVTPHPGEAARMLGSSVEEVQANRPAALEALSGRYGGCYVVLKGYQTLVGRTGEPLFVNSSGSPSLGQGGTGDVLAGYAAGWLAQPWLPQDAGLVLRYAVWQHGAVADRLDEEAPGWTPEELVGRLGSCRPEA